MVKADAIEGIVNETYRFHYDLFTDVLYLQLLGEEGARTEAELTDDGDLLLRKKRGHRVVGLTVVSWWKRFGEGRVPDSIREISRRIAPLARKLAA